MELEQNHTQCANCAKWVWCKPSKRTWVGQPDLNVQCVECHDAGLLPSFTAIMYRIILEEPNVKLHGLGSRRPATTACQAKALTPRRRLQFAASIPVPDSDSDDLTE